MFAVVNTLLHNRRKLNLQSLARGNLLQADNNNVNSNNNDNKMDSSPDFLSPVNEVLESDNNSNSATRSKRLTVNTSAHKAESEETHRVTRHTRSHPSPENVELEQFNQGDDADSNIYASNKLQPKSPAPSGPIRRCQHVNQIDKTATEETIQTPDRWLCDKCNTSGSIRLCLHCGKCICAKHAANHSTKNAHFLFMQFNSDDKAVYCFADKCLVANDNENKEIAMIRLHIEQVQNLAIEGVNSLVLEDKSTQKLHWQSISRALKLPYLSARMIEKRQSEDKLRTAVFRWKFYQLFKCFNTWKNHKLERLAAEEQRGTIRRKRKSESTVLNEALEAESGAITALEVEMRGKLEKNLKMAPGVCGLRNLGNTCKLILCQITAEYETIVMFRY
jgi:uncharacterized UBP type Zn finger protein